MEAHIAASQRGPAFGRGMRFGLTGDERLARMVAEGSETAFSALYDRYHQPLYRLCRTLVGNDHDAQDALQSAFTGALVALREGRRDAPLRPWLYRIAHNESISLLRRRRPEVELPDELPSSGTARGRSPHEVAEERARLAMLLSDLRELPDRQRSALVMRELSGLPHEEVAVALGISVGATKQTVLEARKSLAEFAEGRSMGCDEIQRVVSDGDRRMLRGRRVRAHLRGCASCQAFTDAIPARRGDLLALSPALPALAAGGLLARVTGGAAHAHVHGGGGAGLAAGAAGKGIGTVVSVKMLATGAAVVAGAFGAAGVVHHFTATSSVEPKIPLPAARAHHGTRSAHGTARSAHGAAGAARATARRQHATATGRHAHHHAAAAVGTHGHRFGGSAGGSHGAAASHGTGATQGRGLTRTSHGGGSSTAARHRAGASTLHRATHSHRHAVAVHGRPITRGGSSGSLTSGAQGKPAGQTTTTQSTTTSSTTTTTTTTSHTTPQTTTTAHTGGLLSSGSSAPTTRP